MSTSAQHAVSGQPQVGTIDSATTIGSATSAATSTVTAQPAVTAGPSPEVAAELKEITENQEIGPEFSLLKRSTALAKKGSQLSLIESEDLRRRLLPLRDRFTRLENEIKDSHEAIYLRINAWSNAIQTNYKDWKPEEIARVKEMTITNFGTMAERWLAEFLVDEVLKIVVSDDQWLTGVFVMHADSKIPFSSFFMNTFAFLLNEKKKGLNIKNCIERGLRIDLDLTPEEEKRRFSALKSAEETKIMQEATEGTAPTYTTVYPPDVKGMKEEAFQAFALARQGAKQKTPITGEQYREARLSYVLSHTIIYIRPDGGISHSGRVVNRLLDGMPAILSTLGTYTATSPVTTNTTPTMGTATASVQKNDVKTNAEAVGSTSSAAANTIAVNSKLSLEDINKKLKNPVFSDAEWISGTLCLASSWTPKNKQNTEAQSSHNAASAIASPWGEAFAFYNEVCTLMQEYVGLLELKKIILNAQNKALLIKYVKVPEFQTNPEYNTARYCYIATRAKRLAYVLLTKITKEQWIAGVFIKLPLGYAKNHSFFKTFVKELNDGLKELGNSIVQYREGRQYLRTGQETMQIVIAAKLHQPADKELAKQTNRMVLNAYINGSYAVSREGSSPENFSSSAVSAAAAVPTPPSAAAAATSTATSSPAAAAVILVQHNAQRKMTVRAAPSINVNHDAHDTATTQQNVPYAATAAPVPAPSSAAAALVLK